MLLIIDLLIHVFLEPSNCLTSKFVLQPSFFEISRDRWFVCEFTYLELCPTVSVVLITIEYTILDPGYIVHQTMFLLFLLHKYYLLVLLEDLLEV